MGASPFLCVLPCRRWLGCLHGIMRHFIASETSNTSPVPERRVAVPRPGLSGGFVKSVRWRPTDSVATHPVRPSRTLDRSTRLPSVGQTDTCSLIIYSKHKNAGVRSRWIALDVAKATVQGDHESLGCGVRCGHGGGIGTGEARE